MRNYHIILHKILIESSENPQKHFLFNYGMHGKCMFTVWKLPRDSVNFCFGWKLKRTWTWEKREKSSFERVKKLLWASFPSKLLTHVDTRKLAEAVNVQIFVVCYQTRFCWLCKLMKLRSFQPDIIPDPFCTFHFPAFRYKVPSHFSALFSQLYSRQMMSEAHRKWKRSH